jgi:hypothetical protein
MRIVFIAKDPALFDRAELIGEGKQATLEVAVDETATKGRYELPAPKPQPMPGQTKIED